MSAATSTLIPSQPSPVPSEVTSESPTDLPSSWSFRTIAAPSGHPSFVVRGVSEDGRTVLFQDKSVYDEAFVEVLGAVSQIIPPGHQAGQTISLRLSPSSDKVLVVEANRLALYDINHKSVASIRDLPGRPGLITYEFVSDTVLAVLANNATSPGPTNTSVWLVDLPAGDARLITQRTDADFLYPVDGGLVLSVRGAGAHPTWKLLRLDPGQNETPLFDVTGYSYVAIDRSGLRLALADGEEGSGGVAIVDVTSGTRVELPTTGIPLSFSPDGSRVAVKGPGTGNETTFTVTGDQVGSVSNAAQGAWSR